METTTRVESLDENTNLKIEELLGKVYEYFHANHGLVLEKKYVPSPDITDGIKIHLFFKGDALGWNISIKRFSYKEQEILAKKVRELDKKKLDLFFLERKLEF